MHDGDQPLRKQMLLMCSLVAALAVTLAACASLEPEGVFGRKAWQKIDTVALACRPTEVVIVRNLYLRTGADVTGVVRFEQGGVSTGIKDVRVTVRALGGGDILRSSLTDSSGRFVLLTLPDGWYQIETCRDGWNAAVVPLRVRRSGSWTPVVLNISIAN
jgi:hypothetical protein